MQGGEIARIVTSVQFVASHATSVQQEPGKDKRQQGSQKTTLFRRLGQDDAQDSEGEQGRHHRPQPCRYTRPHFACCRLEARDSFGALDGADIVDTSRKTLRKPKSR